MAKMTPTALAVFLLLLVGFSGCLSGVSSSRQDPVGPPDASTDSQENGTDTFNGTWHWAFRPRLVTYPIENPLARQTGDDRITFSNRPDADGWNLTLRFNWTDPSNLSEWRFKIVYKNDPCQKWVNPDNDDTTERSDCWQRWKLQGPTPLLFHLNSSSPVVEDAGWDKTTHINLTLEAPEHVWSLRTQMAHRRVDWQAAIDYR